MNLYEVHFTETFINDLEQIQNYITYEIGNPKSAKKIADCIVIKCHKLTLFPKASAVRFIVDDKEMRYVHYGNYTIVYSVRKKSRVIDIEYIVYSRRNIFGIQ